MRSFLDKRLLGSCVYCGGPNESRDHVPSRILLDEPFPDNLPVVACCNDCNKGFSLDEQYVACFIECVIVGSTSPSDIHREKISRTLAENRTLAKKIASSETVLSDGQQIWSPEIERVKKVAFKLAQGHAAYDLGLPQLDEPTSINCTPLVALDEHSIQQFFNPQESLFHLWPEIGSRAFINAVETGNLDCWNIVQPERYQYYASQFDGVLIRLVLREYLACEVRWDCL